MFAQERQLRIVELLKERARLSVPELEAALGASPATIRRDLSFLEDAGKALRTHGGALAADHGGGEIPYGRKNRQEAGAKRAIADLAAAMVAKGDSVYVDSGTTAFRVGVKLLSREGITVFTNSIPLLSEEPAPGCRLIALGGEVRAVSLAMVGHGALAWIRSVRFDVAFIGASGIDAGRGPCTTELGEAGVKSAAIRGARRVVLVADASKWRQSAAIRFAEWRAFDDVITDYRPNPHDLANLARHGVRIHNPRK